MLTSNILDNAMYWYQWHQEKIALHLDHSKPDELMPVRELQEEPNLF